MDEQLKSFQLSPVPDRNHHKRIILYAIGVILLLIIGGGVGYMVGTNYNQLTNHIINQRKQQSILRIPTATIPPSMQSVRTSLTQSPFSAAETKETHIASSLDDPILDPQLQWQESTISGTESIDYSSTEYNLGRGEFFTGKIWKAKLLIAPTPAITITGTVIYDILYEYYYNLLSKQNWVSAYPSSPSYLIFKSFKLMPTWANGDFGEEYGFIGYKDKMVRYIVVSRNLDTQCPAYTNVPCYMPVYYDFTVFVSDPVTLTTIANYIQANPPK